jgi:hypothetical protein
MHSRARAGVSLLMGLVCALAFAAVADGRVYWASFANGGRGQLGLASLDGSVSAASLITGIDEPRSVAVDGNYLYWSSASAIGRARLDGSQANPNFITGIHLGGYSMAVSGGYIYWANVSSASIGRAKLDASGVDQNFITASSSGLDGVAVDGSHVYWTGGLENIGRANLDGSEINESLVAGPPGYGIAVDSGHIYWAAGCSGECSGNSIMRANLDGSDVVTLVKGLSSPAGVAVDATHIYWSESHSIGRANLDGSGVKRKLITLDGRQFGEGLAVDGLPGPTGSIGAGNHPGHKMNGAKRCSKKTAKRHRGQPCSKRQRSRKRNHR